MAFGIALKWSPAVSLEAGRACCHSKQVRQLLSGTTQPVRSLQDASHLLVKQVVKAAISCQNQKVSRLRVEMVALAILGKIPAVSAELHWTVETAIDM